MVTLISKPGKDSMRKESYDTISLINLHVKILNKLLANPAINFSKQNPHQVELMPRLHILQFHLYETLEKGKTGVTETDQRSVVVSIPGKESVARNTETLQDERTVLIWIVVMGTLFMGEFSCIQINPFTKRDIEERWKGLLLAKSGEI